MKGANRKDGEGLFTRAYSDRTKGNGFKIKESRFRLDISLKLFTVRVVRPWQLPKKLWMPHPKARLDRALSKLV